jgi:hypothetical protein
VPARRRAPLRRPKADLPHPLNRALHSLCDPPFEVRAALGLAYVMTNHESPYDSTPTGIREPAQPSYTNGLANYAAGASAVLTAVTFVPMFVPSKL